MDMYSLYTFSFIEDWVIQVTLDFDPQFNNTSDKNLKLDRLFGGKKANVTIKNVKKGTFPCTVLAHLDRVVWLRLENEKSASVYVKSQSKSGDIDPIEKYNIPSNPFSYIFIDCREGKNLIAIKKDSDAWRNTDVEARLLEDNLNKLMKDQSFGFSIKINPVTMPKDFWDYNRKLIKKQKLNVKKMTIYFTKGCINPEVEAVVNRTPHLRRLLKELWDASHGQVTYYNPFGPDIFDGRKHDIKNIIELITSNMKDNGFGLSLEYDNGIELTCGKDIRIEYPMRSDTFDMLFCKNLFGEYNVNDWLDAAIEYIKKQKDETTAITKRKRNTPKIVSNTSTALSLF